MDVDRYFQVRADLIVRLLREPSSKLSCARDRCISTAGILCLVAPMPMVLWASKSLIDPGYFNRFSWLMVGFVTAGVVLLSVAQGAHVLIARAAIASRDLLMEKTLGNLLKVDGSIAHKLLAGVKLE